MWYCYGFVCTHIHTHTLLHMHISPSLTYMHTYTCTHIQTHTYTRARSHIHAHFRYKTLWRYGSRSYFFKGSISSSFTCFCHVIHQLFLSFPYMITIILNMRLLHTFSHLSFLPLCLCDRFCIWLDSRGTKRPNSTRLHSGSGPGTCFNAVVLVWFDNRLSHGVACTFRWGKIIR